MGWKGFALLWISYCAISNLLTGLQGLLNFFLSDLFLVLVLVISHVVSHSGILEFYHIFVHMKTSGWLYKTLKPHLFFQRQCPTPLCAVKHRLDVFSYQCVSATTCIPRSANSLCNSFNATVDGPYISILNYSKPRSISQHIWIPHQVC